MNERFEKLAEQAGLKSEIMLDDSSREVECFVAQYDECIPSIHYWEKFAELILLDVRLLIADGRIENDNPVVDDVLVSVLISIEKHFGVEK